MVEYKIIGITEKNGNYQGSPWHNMYLHCVSDSQARNLLGNEVAIFKIKWGDVPQAFELGTPAFRLPDFSKLIGRKAYIYFDRYGTATKVTVIKEDNADSKGSKPN